MFGVASMTSELRRVALRKPSAAMLDADAAVWHYGPTFDRNKVLDQHAAFSALVEGHGTEVLWMEDHGSEIADAVFTYDASLMTPEGGVLMNPGKPLRKGEQELHRTFYEANGIAVFGEITGDGTMEAGDTCWLDEKTLAIGRGFRTNQAGIEQMTEIMAKQGVTVHAFDLPVYQGAAACLHLMSLVSPVDTRTAVIHETLFPVGLYQLMQSMGYQLINLPADEYEASATLSGNILALAPGVCIMIDGFPHTRAAIESAGVQVSVFNGEALCIGCEGGPTCLSRPILRD
ncbi:MAG: arginine deiminase family protein [Pseudomonadota bacterium]